MEERKTLETSRELTEIELVEVSQKLKDLVANGKMLEIRKLSKTDDEFLNALSTATNTSREMIDWISLYTLLPIAMWGYESDFNYGGLTQEDVC